MTQAEALALFSYDEKTGVLRWARSRKGVPAGHTGGTNLNGYTRFRTGGKSYMAHRLIWLMHYGEWPTGDVDHINGKRSDNRLCNLREATRANNCWNAGAKRGTFKGIHKRGRKWRAQIVVEGRDIDLGSHNTDIEAARAYDAAAIKYHGEFARLNLPESRNGR